MVMDEHEVVFCPLCDSKARLIREIEGFRTFQCLNCEFVFDYDEGKKDSITDLCRYT